MHPTTLNALYGAPLPEKFQLAHRLWAEFGERLLSLASLRNHLQTCVLLQDEVRLRMEECGMPAFCQACACAAKSGGCCSFAMTDENDAVLLLLNLLSGSPVAIQRDDETECLFLGTDGCSLRFKPFFCLNYLCRQLRDKLDPGQLRQLERTTGRLLQQQYAVEQFLLRQLDAHLQMQREMVRRE